MWLLYTLLTLCMLCAAAYIIIRQFGYTKINPNHLVLISRFKIHHRTVTTDNLQDPSILLIPGIEKITHRINKRLRQIVVPIKLEENNVNIIFKLKVKYQVIAKKAKLAATQLPQPVPAICDYLNEKLPETSLMLDKDNKALFQSTLTSVIKEQLNDYLHCYGYNLLSLTIEKMTIADKISFDITHTQTIISLLQAPHDKRDSAWWDTFCQHIFTANFASADEPVQAISQSLHALIINPPTDEYFENPIQAKDALQTCLEKGLGLAIKNPEDEHPLLTLSFLEVYAITNGQLDELILQQAIPPGPFYDPEANWIPMGPIDEKSLDPVILKGVSAYLKQLGIETPQGSKVAQSGGDYSTSLTFNVFREQFNSDQDFEAFIRQFYWYIPRHIGIIGMSSECAAAAELNAID